MMAAFLVSARAQSVSVPALLSKATVRAGLSFVGGGVDSPLSPRVVKLANSALRSVPWRLLAVLALVLALVTGGLVGRYLDRADAAGSGTAADSACHPSDGEESPGAAGGR
jgi:hypothetical protein